MQNRVVVISIAVLACLASVHGAQDAESILRIVREKRVERWEGVENYAVEKTMNGMRSVVVHERVTSDGPEAVPAFRMVPPGEFQRRRSEAAGQRALTPDELEIFADAHEQLGEGMGNQIEKDMSAMGLPPGLLRVSGMDPRQSGAQNAFFLRQAAAGQRKNASGGMAALTGTDAGENMDAFAVAAQLVGEEEVDGRNAFLLRADDLNLASGSEDQEFVMRTMSLWIDTEHYVPLRMKMEGVTGKGLKAAPFVMELLHEDYRPVEESNMYESFRQVIRMAGVLTPKQQADMKKAQQKMAEFEKQMAGMPESQRNMIMSRMGPQMEMMRKMASGGGMELVTDVNVIRVNVGVSDDDNAPGPPREFQVGG